MTEMLVTLILAVCPPSLDGGTNQCMEYMVNCVIGPGGKWDHKDVDRCVEEYKNGNTTSPQIED